jgi:hypothetical protein
MKETATHARVNTVDNHVMNDSQIRLTAPVHDDRVGKPFLVVDHDTRRCLVCDQLFSRREAPKHARIVCSSPNQ